MYFYLNRTCHTHTHTHAQSMFGLRGNKKSDRFEFYLIFEAVLTGFINLYFSCMNIPSECVCLCASLPAGMSHEPKSSALGMISAAPCTMATVSPLTPSPISGSPASQSGHSGFAAALRKLAKQAEEPRGECVLSSPPHPSVLTLFSLSSHTWCHSAELH